MRPDPYSWTAHPEAVIAVATLVAAYVLAVRALTDVWTVIIAVASFVVLTRWKVSELWLILAAGLLGLANSFRMARLPDPTPSGSTEGVTLG